jgi:hypothetical protein
MICKNSHDMQNLIRVADAITTTIFRALDWFYLTLILFVLGLAVWLALSPHGHLKLGNPNDTPEFSTLSWLAMLFAAGMGAGRKPASIAPAALGLKRARHPLKRRRDAIRRLLGVLGNTSPQFGHFCHS